MTYLIVIIIAVMVFSPWLMPWGKKLLVCCVAVWFILWVVFFIQVERENNPAYDAAIISDSVALGASLVVFMLVIVLRCLARFVGRTGSRG